MMKDLADKIAEGIDLAAIAGDGTGNAPTGVLNVSGIGDVAIGANGGPVTWDSVVDLESAVAAANADTGRPGYLTNSPVRGAAKKIFIDAGSGQRIWDSRTPQAPLNGYRAIVSNQVPSDLDKGTSTGVCSALIFGNWADLLIGMWGGLDLLVNPYSLDTTGAVRITAFQDVDINVRHPQSFAAIQDITT
jgi:HK97 family phage major capsid protein